MKKYYTNKLLKVSINVTLIALMLFAFLTVNVSASEKYTDTEHWAKNYINYVTEQGYFEGTSESTFNPDDNMTRGMFITVLARYNKADLSGYSLLPFSDISKDQYYTKPILWAYSKNLVSGTSDNTFSPDLNITREQVAMILSTYFIGEYVADIPKQYTDEEANFNDMNLASSWAYYPIQIMKLTKVFCGDENRNFNPQEYLTRAECAVIFSRLDKKSFDIYKIEKEVAVINYLSGKASAYSFSLIGHITASGEYLSSTAYTVAVPISKYKTYAGKHVEISYNGITIVATCNDCGGFEKYGRVLDLSPGIIKTLGFNTANSWGVQTISYRWID